MKMRVTSRAQDKKLVVNNSLKKNPKAFLELEKEFFENAIEKHLSMKFCKYVWYTLIYTSKGYGFNCVSKNTIIKRIGDEGKSFKPTVGEAYRIKNDSKYAQQTKHYSLFKKYRRLGYGYGLSLFEDGKVRKNKIIDIYQMGIRPVYRLTIEDGQYIECTENHKFPTKNGEKMLYQLEVGEELYVLKSYNDIKPQMVRIKSIEYIGEEEVYDIEMAHPAHNFAINTGLITSNSAHTLAYSLIGLQELNIVFKYGQVYWNTANLIVDSGSLDEDGNTNYGKIATAIARIKKEGIKINLPLINSAEKNFIPDEATNSIYYSLKAINGVGDDDIENIINNRPFASLQDFCERMIVPKIIKNSTMISLIKAGCFEDIDGVNRAATMERYLRGYVHTPNTSLTMSNIARMTELNIIPEDIKETLRLIKYKAYVTSDKFLYQTVINEGKKVPKAGYHDRLFKLDDIAMEYFKANFNEDSVVEVVGQSYVISEKLFSKQVDSKIESVKLWLKSENTLNSFNEATYRELWKKHASGTISTWEMASLSFYYTKHELDGLNLKKYGVTDYFNLPREPESYDSFVRYIDGKQIFIPKYNIVRLAGTVLNADNMHYTVSLLTTTGTVNVKFNKGQYAFYNRQISAHVNGEAKKTVLDRSWFKRGTLLLVCGYRQDDNFRAYRYKDTVYLHTVALIDKINPDGTLDLKFERENPDEYQNQG